MTKHEPAAVTHTLAPIYDAQSQILILGTMPSPQSRTLGFYYGHPQNRFWSVLANLFQVPRPVTADACRSFALAHHIALWDVLASCEITGAADSSIRNPLPNDIAALLDQAPQIQGIFTTGQKAADLYRRLVLPLTNVPAIPLPSTSAANAQFSLAQLTEAYRIILPHLMTPPRHSSTS